MPYSVMQMAYDALSCSTQSARSRAHVSGSRPAAASPRARPRAAPSGRVSGGGALFLGSTEAVAPLRFLSPSPTIIHLFPPPGAMAAEYAELGTSVPSRDGRYAAKHPPRSTRKRIADRHPSRLLDSTRPDNLPLATLSYYHQLAIARRTTMLVPHGNTAPTSSCRVAGRHHGPAHCAPSLAEASPTAELQMWPEAGHYYVDATSREPTRPSVIPPSH